MSVFKKPESHADRLTTADERGRRIYVYPAEVKGRYQRLRSLAHTVLIGVFLALPWVRVNGSQALLLDVARRRFAIFGITFWAHDAPMLVFIVGGAALTLGLATALWGRVWCGWACPQTVFIESLFRRIERAIEGDHLARRKLDAAPLDADKAFKKAMKWGLFTVVALVVTHSFLAYFVGTEALATMIRSSPAKNPASFTFMAVLSGAILFDFGWFREQFCTVVCPYGRFQSLLMDEQSLLVTYDTNRSDCVSCNRCVQVCPTGIDIRNGAQLECIGCTACIDACDDVMARLRRPLGLIRYDSAAGLSGKPTTALRPRVVVYGALVALLAVGLIYNVATRRPVEATFVRAADTPYTEISATEIVNRFKVDLSNQSFEDLELKLAVDTGKPGTAAEVVTALGSFKVAGGRKLNQEAFVKFPKSLLASGHATVTIRVVDPAGKTLTAEEVTLVGPYR
ncbi:MAG: 4Fe-4S dicluster domain-containing protein [Deltaproteobacteria bacterium]|nr:4Fe-4S dicluster domain-containing protein [Deltaproteobacteria bacterium]